jgi:hypothetical protein
MVTCILLPGSAIVTGLRIFVKHLSVVFGAPECLNGNARRDMLVTYSDSQFGIEASAGLPRHQAQPAKASIPEDYLNIYD